MTTLWSNVSMRPRKVAAAILATAVAGAFLVVPAAAQAAPAPPAAPAAAAPPAAPAVNVTPAQANGTFLRPFSAGSLWYRPVSVSIAAGAYYGTGNGSTASPGITVPKYGVSVDVEWIIQGSTSFPAQNLMTTYSWPASNQGGTNTGKVVQIDPSLDIPFDSGMSLINAAGAYLTPDGSTWYEGNAIMIHPAGSTPYMGNVYADEANSGAGTYGGRGASGLSSVGGALRPVQLEGSAPIAHALSLTAPMAAWGMNNAGFKGGGGFTTPAVSADGGYDDPSSGNYYGGNAFPMGALLAIAPADLPAALAAVHTVQGRNTVNAMATYGAYVTENSSSPPGSGWDPWMYQMDNAAVNSSGIQTAPVKADLANLLPYLHVVEHNDPAVNGGPVPPTAPPATWSQWSAAGSPPVGAAQAPAVASWSPGRLDLFVKGRDNSLWHSFQAPGTAFSAWENLGGQLTSAPTAISWSPGRIDVFAQGTDHALWHKWWSGTAWSAWESLGGRLAVNSAPAVASWSAGRLDVVVRGTDNPMWHRYWSPAGWSNWESLGGVCTADPGATSLSAGSLDVFCLGGTTNPSALYHRFFRNGLWSSWAQEVPGGWAKGITATSWSADRLDVFGADASTGALAHAWWDGLSWHKEVLDGFMASTPTVTSSDANHIDVFVLGTNGQIWHKSWS